VNTIQLNVLETTVGGETGATGGATPKAVIRIKGLTSIPADPMFRIEPIDDALIEDGNVDWPSGPRRPAAVLAGNNQFDLVLGPDVLDSRLLVAGTPVSVSLCGTPAVSELVWPDMQVHAARPKRPVILTEQLRAAEREAIEARRREAAIEQARVEAAAAAAVEAERLATETARRHAAERLEASRKPRLVAMPAQLPTVPEIDHQKEASAFVETLLGTSDAMIPTDLYASQEPETPADMAKATPPAAHFERMETKPTQQLSQLKRYKADAPTAPAMQLPVLSDKLNAVVSTFSAAGEAGDQRRRQIGAFAAGLVAAMVLMFGLVQLKLLPFGGGRGAQTPDIALASARANGTLRSVLATGGVSPRGRQTAGIDAVTALTLADRHLHGTDLPRDQGEASFWLRHALSQALEPEAMRWALTQLGTIHAAPEGFEPDYTKARMLWEVSSALGDPVAMCFNGSLYEYGLGIARHKDLAHALYERARNAGGCPGVEQAISRTR
jgi:hypothetical protein